MTSQVVHILLVKKTKIFVSETFENLLLKAT
jgi:hypothetical protein